MRVDSVLDWFGEVYHEKAVTNPPKRDDYSYGTFVRVEALDVKLVAIINNAHIYNPDYGLPNIKPLLPQQNKVIFPDFFNEIKKLISLYCLGYIDGGRSSHDYPTVVPELHDKIFKMSHNEIREFHTRDGKLSLSYLPRVSNFHDYPYMLDKITTVLRKVCPESLELIDKVQNECQFGTCIQGMGRRR
ncbi:MAG: hypothetical protein WCE82_11375 [Halobacteriota archaeon]